MPYATLSDLINRAGEFEIQQVADRDRDGEPDDNVVAAALRDADNLIDGYLATKFAQALPLSPVPDIVTTWAVSIARYILHRDGAPDHVAQDHKDAIAALKDVARGLIALPVSGPATLEAVGTVMAVHPAQVFSPSKLRGW